VDDDFSAAAVQDLNATGTTSEASSVGRTNDADTNTSTDWAQGASTWGRLTPTRRRSAGRGNDHLRPAAQRHDAGLPRRVAGRSSDFSAQELPASVAQEVHQAKYDVRERDHLPELLIAVIEPNTTSKLAGS